MASGINPIIQSLIETTRLGQESRQRKETERSNKAQESDRAAQLKQAMDIANQAHDLQQQHIDLLHQAQQNELAHNQFQDRIAIQKGVAAGEIAIPKGTRTQEDVPQFPGGFGGFQIPAQSGNVKINGIDIPADQLVSPAMHLQRKGAEALAIQNAQLPRLREMEDLRYKRESDLADKTADRADATSEANYARAMDVANANNTSQEKRQDMRDAAMIQAAGIRGLQHGVDPKQVSALADDIATGRKDVTGTTPAVLAAGETNADRGFVQFSIKQGQALREAPNLNNWLNSLDAFADKYLPTSKPGAMVQGTLNSVKGLPTDAKNAFNQLKTNAINAGKTLEGISGGRITVQQLNLLLDGMSGLGITKAQGHALAENLRQRYKEELNTGLLGGMPDEQKELTFKRHGVTPESLGLAEKSTQPDWLKIAPQKSKGGRTLDSEKSIEVGHPVYK